MESDKQSGSGRGWFKARASATNSCCVEVLEGTDDTVRIRDSKWAGDPDRQPIISISSAAWTRFLSEVRNGG